MILISNSSPHAEVAIPLIPQLLLPREEKGSKISFLVPLSLNATVYTQVENLAKSMPIRPLAPNSGGTRKFRSFKVPQNWGI